MDGSDLFRLLHTLALFWAIAGLGAVMVPVGGNWGKKDMRQQLVAFEQAANAETAMFLPGYLLIGVTGFFWATFEGYNFLNDGWLLALTVIYLVTIVIFVPLMDFSLRRARLFALQAAKTGEVTQQFQDALNDNVPLVFGALISVAIPIMAWLAIYKPF
ncbi:MAG: DUF2269 family protein [Dehalococcoidia bacterium]|nr:DUF2269 family protein [Dehalococcoidia bacterium]